MESVARAMSKTRHRNQIPAISQPRNLDANPRCELNGFSHPTQLPNARLDVAARSSGHGHLPGAEERIRMIRNPQSLEDKYAQLAFDTAFRCKENTLTVRHRRAPLGEAQSCEFRRREYRR